MMYFSNGGFDWIALYSMPVKLREFYWRELLNTKQEEKDRMDAVTSKPPKNPNSRVRRR